MTEHRTALLVSGFLAIAFTLANVHNGPGQNLPSLAYSSAFLLLSVPIVARGFGLKFQNQLTPALTLYMAWMGASVFWSALPENSFYYFWLLSSMPLVYLVARQLPMGNWPNLLNLLMIPICFSAIWGIAEFAATGHRANGPLLDPNGWAAVHNLCFFVALSQYLSGNTHSALKQRGIEAVLLLLAVALFSAYSRVATVIWLVAMCVVLGIGVIGKLERRKLVSVVLLSALAYGMVHSYASQEQASHDEGYTLDFKVTGWTQRFAIWGAAWEIYQENPYTGSGLATFNVKYPAHRTTGDLTNTGNFVHNDYLQFLQEGGPIQLIFLLSFVVYLLVLFWRNAVRFLRELAPGYALEMLVLIVAMGTPLVHSLMNFTLFLLPIQMALGFLLVRVSGLNQLLKPAVTDHQVAFKSIDNHSRHGSSFPRLILWPGFSALVLAWSVLLVDAISFALIYEQKGIPGSHWVRKEADRYFEAIFRLAQIRPGNSSNHIALATLYRKTMDRQTEQAAIDSLAVAAAAEYRAGLSINPYRYAIQIYYADLLDYHPVLYEVFPDEVKPAEILERSLAVNPIYLQVYTRLAWYYQRQGESDKAYQLLKDRGFTWIDLNYNNYEIEQVRFVSLLTQMAIDRHDGEMLSRLLEWHNQRAPEESG